MTRQYPDKPLAVWRVQTPVDQRNRFSPNDPSINIPETLYEAHIVSHANDERMYPSTINPEQPPVESTPIEALLRAVVDVARAEGFSWIDLTCALGFHWRMAKYRDEHRKRLAAAAAIADTDATPG